MPTGILKKRISTQPLGGAEWTLSSTKNIECRTGNIEFRSSLFIIQYSIFTQPLGGAGSKTGRGPRKFPHFNRQVLCKYYSA